MAIQFNPKHTIAAHEAYHRHEVEAFKDSELDTDDIEWASFPEKLDTAVRTLSNGCVLSRIKDVVFIAFMDCVTLRPRTALRDEPEPHYVFLLREDLVSGNALAPAFQLDYTFIRSISFICRFCTAMKEQTKEEVAATDFLSADLSQMIVEYLYPKAESHREEEAERQQMKYKVAVATGLRELVPIQTIVDYLYP